MQSRPAERNESDGSRGVRYIKVAHTALYHTLLKAFHQHLDLKY